MSYPRSGYPPKGPQCTWNCNPRKPPCNRPGCTWQARKAVMDAAPPPEDRPPPLTDAQNMRNCRARQREAAMADARARLSPELAATLASGAVPRLEDLPDDAAALYVLAGLPADGHLENLPLGPDFVHETPLLGLRIPLHWAGGPAAFKAGHRAGTWSGDALLQEFGGLIDALERAPVLGEGGGIRRLSPSADRHAPIAAAQSLAVSADTLDRFADGDGMGGYSGVKGKPAPVDTRWAEHKRGEGACTSSEMGAELYGLRVAAVNGAGDAPGQPQGRGGKDRKSTRLNSSHITRSRMPSSA